MSVGTVAAWTSRAAALEPFTAVARAALSSAELVHLDETGLRVAGRLDWLPVASARCSPCWSAIADGARRRSTPPGCCQASLGSRCTFAPYARYGSATHALCNAHLWHELIAVVDPHAVQPRSADRRGCRAPRGRRRLRGPGHLPGATGRGSGAQDRDAGDAGADPGRASWRGGR